MKKTFLVLLTMLFVLTLASCSFISQFIGGENNNDTPVTGEYEYKFAVGTGDNVVNIAYVVKTSYTKSSDSTGYEVFAKVNGEAIESRLASGVFDGKEGIININGIWDLELKDGVITPLSAPSGSNIIGNYGTMQGTYALESNSQLHEMNNGKEDDEKYDFTLKLNADGTGSLININLTYYPIQGNKIVIFNENSEQRGVILDLNYNLHTYKPQEDSLAYNFGLGTGIENYYKIFLGTSTTHSGEGIFMGQTLHSNGTHFYLEGQSWVLGKCELKNGIMSLIFDNTPNEDGGENTIEVAITDYGFDYEKAKSYVAGYHYIHIYKNGGAYVNTKELSGTYSVANGIDGLDVPAVCDQNKVYVFDKETLDLVATFSGDTYVDISSYTKYTNRAAKPGVESISNIYVSSDKKTVLRSHYYPSENTKIEYENLNTSVDAEVHNIGDDTVITTNYCYYFLMDGTYIEVNSYDYSELRSSIGSAVSYSISAMPTMHTTIYWYNENVYTYETEGTYVAKICWEDNDESVLYIVISISDSDGSAYASFIKGRTVVSDVDGVTITVNGSNYITLVKNIGTKLIYVDCELDSDIDASKLEYIGKEGDYLILLENGTDTHYLINKNTLECDYIIIDPDYTGIADTQIVSMAGVSDYDDSVLPYNNYSFFAEILVLDNKTYVPIKTMKYLNCCVYEARESVAFPELMTNNVIKLSPDEDYVGDYYDYYYITEDGYYNFAMSTALDPANLASFTKNGETAVYAITESSFMLELSKYTDPAGNEYMLILGYSLNKFYMEDSSYGEACMSMPYSDFGTFTETADGYIITGTIDGTVYTVTIDGENATVMQTEPIA